MTHAERGSRSTGRWRHRGRVAEAIALMSVGMAAQRWVPMPRWAGALGEPRAVPDSWRGRRMDAIATRAEDEVELGVARAVARARARLPAEPSCLADAFAGQVMLRRRGRAGVVVIGLRPSPDARNEEWDAHAWLLGRAGALTGGQAAGGFTATTVFEPRRDGRRREAATQRLSSVRRRVWPSGAWQEARRT